MKKITVFLLLISTTLFSQQKENFDEVKYYKLNQVTSLPVLKGSKIIKLKESNTKEFKKAIKRHLIIRLPANLLPKTEFGSKTKYYIEVVIEKDNKIFVNNTNIKNKRLDKKVRKIFKKIKVVEPAKLEGKNVSIKFIFKLTYNNFL